MKKLLFCFYVFIVLFSLSACRNNQQDNSLKEISINGKKLQVEIADTSELRYRGLSNRQALPENQGMLFVFKNYSRPTFVMREMNFPLDIIWIRDKAVMQIDKNTQPLKPSELKYYSSAGPVNYVLEVNAGWADENGVRVGNKVEGL